MTDPVAYVIPRDLVGRICEAFDAAYLGEMTNQQVIEVRRALRSMQPLFASPEGKLTDVRPADQPAEQA